MPNLNEIFDEEDTQKVNFKPDMAFRFTDQERQTLTAILDVFRYKGSPWDLITLLNMPGASTKVLKEVIEELYYQNMRQV